MTQVAIDPGHTIDLGQIDLGRFHVTQVDSGLGYYQVFDMTQVAIDPGQFVWCGLGHSKRPRTV